MNTVMFFYRREALQASQLSFLLPNHHTNLRELTFFIHHHHLITYAGLFQLDRHVVVLRKLQQYKGYKYFHAFFLNIMNTASPAVGEMGYMGNLLWHFQISLNTYNINSSDNDKNQT
jgi:hypothetical protein